MTKTPTTYLPCPLHPDAPEHRAVAVSHNKRGAGTYAIALYCSKCGRKLEPAPTPGK